MWPNQCGEVWGKQSAGCCHYRFLAVGRFPHHLYVVGAYENVHMVRKQNTEIEIQTRRALGRAHLPPTTVFRRLTTTRRCCKGRPRPNTCTWYFPDVIKFCVAVHTIQNHASLLRRAPNTHAQYLYVGFFRRNKIPRWSAHAMEESNPVPVCGLWSGSG